MGKHFDNKRCAKLELLLLRTQVESELMTVLASSVLGLIFPSNEWVIYLSLNAKPRLDNIFLMALITISTCLITRLRRSINCEMKMLLQHKLQKF